MSRALLVVGLVASLLTTGCVAHGQNRGAADAVNGVLIFGGAALAIAGRCGAVRLLEGDVAAADPAYHADVFRTDPLVAACL